MAKVLSGWDVQTRKTVTLSTPNLSWQSSLSLTARSRQPPVSDHNHGLPPGTLTKLLRTFRMLNPPTHLTIRRPSPTTLSFTASNAPLRTSLSAHVIFYLTILLRVLLGLSVLLITAAKVSDSPQFHGVRVQERDVLGGSIAAFVVSIAEKFSWRILIPSTLVTVYIVCRKSYIGTLPNLLIILSSSRQSHPPINCKRLRKSLTSGFLTEESLLVLRGLGIQTCTSSPTYLSTSTTRFIPTDQIQDIFIHEAFKAFEVRFYLAVIVEGEGEVVVVFPVSLHRSILLCRTSSSDAYKKQDIRRTG